MKFRSHKFLAAFVAAASLIIFSGCLGMFNRVSGEGQQASAAKPNALAVSAKVVEIQGKAETRMSTNADFASAAVGDTINVNGQVKTLENGRVRLDLSSGTIIRVAPNSIFTLESNERVDNSLATKLNLELGKIFVILNGGSLDISTGAGVASVRGSYMSVTIDIFTNNVIVTCLEGRCNADDKDISIDFTNGEKIILYAPNASGKHHKADKTTMIIKDFYEWLNEAPEAEDMVIQISHDKGLGVNANNCAPNCGSENGGGNGNNDNGPAKDHNSDGHEDSGKGKK